MRAYLTRASSAARGGAGGSAMSLRLRLLRSPGAAPAGGLDGLAGEQQAAALRRGPTLVEGAVGALAAGLRGGRLARIRGVLERLGGGVVVCDQRQVGCARRPHGDW